MKEYSESQTCCFTGHRASGLPWGTNEEDGRCAALKRSIAGVVEELYDAGIRRYICGMALGCDMYFAEIVGELRSRRPDVCLEAAIPCIGQEERWSEANRERYRRLVEGADARTVISHRYTFDCMEKRNRYMVESSSVVVAVYSGGRGGTFNTLRMSYKLGRQIIEIDI